jgi:S-adenosylmethionine decarboxylase
MDYKVRGFTRDVSGKKHYIDHGITSIQNYISEETRNNYQMIDVNVYQEKLIPYQDDAQRNRTGKLSF